MARFSEGSLVLDSSANDAHFQDHCYEHRFVPLTDRLKLINYTTTEPVIDPELASWIRGYIVASEEAVLEGTISRHNAMVNLDDIVKRFGPKETITHLAKVGITPVGPRPPVQGPCYPPALARYPDDMVHPRGDHETCNHCGSIWAAYGMGGGCCNGCGAFL